MTVVIPTYNRPDALAACLDSLVDQQLPDGARLDVLVLNDGGDEEAGEVCAEASMRLPWPLVYHSTPHLGPSGVRNLAFERAGGDVVLILNDDVTLGPGHLATHLARHVERPGHAARGMTRWARDSITDEFMEWVARQSFFYYLIDDLDACGYEYWHTCDLSIDRRWVCGETAIRFDPEFPYAGYEDTEWGWRLEAAGCRLAFLPKAVSEHHHVYSPESLEERGRRNGVCAAILYDLVPELRGRAIYDFLEPADPAAKGMRRVWAGLRRFWPADRGDDESSKRVRRWNKAFTRSYVAGFLGEFERRHGEAFDPAALGLPFKLPKKLRAGGGADDPSTKHKKKKKKDKKKGDPGNAPSAHPMQGRGPAAPPSHDAEDA